MEIKKLVVDWAANKLIDGELFMSGAIEESDEEVTNFQLVGKTVFGVSPFVSLFIKLLRSG